MTLRTLFAIPIAVILLVTLSLAAMIMGDGWSSLVRGRAAVEAVEQMRLLILLDGSLRIERTVSNLALGKAYPLTEPVARRLAGARRQTDLAIGPFIALLHAGAEGRTNAAAVGQYLAETQTRLRTARELVDDLLGREQNQREFAALNAAMPLMLAVSATLEQPQERVNVAVTVIDPSLSSLVTMERLTAALRDQVGLIAAVLLPRLDKEQALTAEDLERVRVLLAQASYLTRLAHGMLGLAGATGQMRSLLAELETVDLGVVYRQLIDSSESEAGNAPDDNGLLPAQRVLFPWGARIDLLKVCIVDATVERVTSSQVTRERKFDIVMTAFGVVMVAVLESVVLLSQRVVGPLAHLGIAITRIAAGDRSVPLTLHSGTREIAEMVTAVETLRQAALIADATAMRQRMAARQRLSVLREALGIAQTVQEPARALERGVARLSEGIDATIALVTTATTAVPLTLGVAAIAVRVGLAEMRKSAADLDAMFAAAGSAQTEDRPQAEFVAHILAVQAQVVRRDAVVRGFVKPSLVALRDAASASGEAPGPVLRDLVSDQFERIEETVATVAAMLATVTRAAAIVRDLPLDDTPMAA